MAILVDHLPHKVSHWMVFFTTPLFLVFASPLDISLAVAVPNCAVCFLLTAELGVEHQARYGDGYTIEVVGLALQLVGVWARVLSLTFESGSDGSRRNAVIAYWTIIGLIIFAATVPKRRSAGPDGGGSASWQAGQSSTGALRDDSSDETVRHTETDLESAPPEVKESETAPTSYRGPPAHDPEPDSDSSTAVSLGGDGGK